MKYTIIEIREDASASNVGMLWFRVLNYHDGQTWWLHLSDEYGGPEGEVDVEFTDARYELRALGVGE